MTQNHMKNATGKNENQTHLLTKDFNLGRPRISRGSSSFFCFRDMQKVLSEELTEQLSWVWLGFQKIFRTVLVIDFPLVSCPQLCRIPYRSVTYRSLDIRLDIKLI